MNYRRKIRIVGEKILQKGRDIEEVNQHKPIVYFQIILNDVKIWKKATHSRIHLARPSNSRAQLHESSMRAHLTIPTFSTSVFGA